MIWSIITSALGGFGGWLLKGPLDRILQSVDKAGDNETERQKMRLEAVNQYVRAQVAILTGPGWWFPLFFIIPLGLWFAAVCIYSILFCKLCAFPQSWTIAALPPPLDEWAGIIVSSLFIGASGVKIMSNLRGGK